MCFSSQPGLSLSHPANANKYQKKNSITYYSVLIMNKAIKQDPAPYGPQGWPSSPGVIRTAVYVTLSNHLIDIVSRLFAVAFLSFVLVEFWYDGTNVAEATQSLERATKHVRLRNLHLSSSDLALK
jgi:hypothetical protein